jgi:hypothetical protein
MAMRRALHQLLDLGPRQGERLGELAREPESHAVMRARCSVAGLGSLTTAVALSGSAHDFGLAAPLVVVIVGIVISDLTARDCPAPPRLEEREHLLNFLLCQRDSAAPAIAECSPAAASPLKEELDEGFVVELLDRSPRSRARRLFRRLALLRFRRLRFHNLGLRARRLAAAPRSVARQDIGQGLPDGPRLGTGVPHMFAGPSA